MASVFCVLVQLGWVAPLSRAWAFNLWQYHLPAIAISLGLGLVLIGLGSRRFREGLIDRAPRLLVANSGAKPMLWALPLVVALLFWTVRERRFLGDSTLLIYHLSHSAFLFPEMGASFLIHQSMHVGRLFGVSGTACFQFLVCLSGACAWVCISGLARTLTDTRRKAVLFTALMFSGGLTRVFAGHVEVYAFVVTCAVGYLWSGCCYLRGRCSWWLPCLAIGCGLWVHLSFAFLLPSTALLLVLATPRLGLVATPNLERVATPNIGWAGYARRMTVGCALAGAPLLVFTIAAGWLGEWGDLKAVWSGVLQTTGVAEIASEQERWLRGWGQSAGPGTRYTILGWPHLKFLVNAFFLLAPAAIPILAVFLRTPRRFIATPEAAFLSTASLSLLIYTFTLRPAWGPYDWDLFSLSAVCLAALASYLLVSHVAEPLLSHLAIVLIGASLALVTIPFLITGITTSRNAGPFAAQEITIEGNESAEEAFQRQIKPWL